MLASQTCDGDLRVWSVAKSYSSDDPVKVVRILRRTENYVEGPNWMGWSKHGRIIQHSDGWVLVMIMIDISPLDCLYSVAYAPFCSLRVFTPSS